ncbi:MAG: T9SS type A sorting domain-containing protein [Bacteroidetes bacterium]|nr:T9SS type A sorting domain-containing protein [Bacteroidota bacterium]
MTLNKVTSVDSVTYYVACDSGRALRSTNAGLNWTVLNTGIPNDIRDVDFINANTGFAIAWEYGLVDPNFYGSIILKTTDAGQTWDSHYKRDDSIFYRKISFINSQFGFLLGEPVGIVRTTNGGSNWIKDYIDTNTFVHGFPVWDIKTIGTQFGIACGGFQDLAGVIWRTTNAGVNWTSQGVAPEPLFALHFYDNQNFIAVGGDFEYGASLVKTTNAGANWDYTPLNEFGIGLNLSFRTESDGWMALGLGQKFLYTFDGGLGWRTIPTPNLETILDVHFSSKRHGVAVGQHAAILIYNSSLVAIDNNTSKLPSSIELKQNYPNPFNPETIISFSLDKPQYVSLKIYDMIGKEIKTLVEGVTGPGEHKIRFDASEIPAGIYFYTLKTDNKVYQTKKMILVK